MEYPTQKEWLEAQMKVVFLRDKMFYAAMDNPDESEAKCYTLLKQAQDCLREAANIGLGLV